MGATLEQIRPIVEEGAQQHFQRTKDRVEKHTGNAAKKIVGKAFRGITHLAYPTVLANPNRKVRSIEGKGTRKVVRFLRTTANVAEASAVGIVAEAAIVHSLPVLIGAGVIYVASRTVPGTMAEVITNTRLKWEASKRRRRLNRGK